VLPCDSSAKGVTLDSDGKVWAISGGGNSGGYYAVRVDPEAGPAVLVGGKLHHVGAPDRTVDLGADAGAYNYSDMSGYVTLSTTIPSGIWDVVYEANSSVTWQRAVWTRENPLTAGTLTVEVRAAETGAGLA